MGRYVPEYLDGSASVPICITVIVTLRPMIRPLTFSVGSQSP